MWLRECSTTILMMYKLSLGFNRLTEKNVKLWPGFLFQMLYILTLCCIFVAQWVDSSCQTPQVFKLYVCLCAFQLNDGSGSTWLPLASWSAWNRLADPPYILIFRKQSQEPVSSELIEEKSHLFTSVTWKWMTIRKVIILELCQTGKNNQY